MDNHRYANSKSPPTTGTSSPYESEPQELKNGTAEVHVRRKKGRIYPDAQPARNFHQRYASPQPILGMPNTSIAGVVSNELSAITASPVPLESDNDAVYNISADEDLPPPPVELLENADDYPRIRFSYGSTDSEQNLHFDDFPPERETRHNLRVRRNDTGSSQSPPTSSLTEKSPSPPSSKSGSKHLRPIPPSDSEDDRKPQEDIKFRSIDFSKYKQAFRRGDSSTDADVCSDGDVNADIHTPLLQEGGGSPVQKEPTPPKDSPAVSVPLLDGNGRESLEKQRRSSSNGSRRGSSSGSQRSRKNGAKRTNGKDPRGSSKSIKSSFEPIEHEDPWSLRTDIPQNRDNRKSQPPQPPQRQYQNIPSTKQNHNPQQPYTITRDLNGRPPNVHQPNIHQPNVHPEVAPRNSHKLDPRDRYADARESSLSTDSSMIRYPLARQYGMETHSPASSSTTRPRTDSRPSMGTQAIRKDDKDRPLETPQGYPLAQFPPGHFPPPPIVERPRDLPRPPQVRDFQTNTGDHTPDPLTTPESALGYRPLFARSQPRNIDRSGRTSPPMKSSVSVGDILFSDAVLPGSLSTGDLRAARQPRPPNMSHVRSVPRDLYAVPNKVAASQQTHRSWRQSAYSVDRVEMDTMPPPPKRQPSVRKQETKKRRFKHLRDRHYPICIAVSFATMLCINPPIGFIAVVFSYLSWKAYDRGDERTGFILARSALYTSLAGIIFTMTVIITTLYQTTIGF